MKILFFVIAFLPSLPSVSQSKYNNKISTDSSIAKWNRSVVALETIQGPSKKLIEVYNTQYVRRLIAPDRFFKIMDSLRDNAERSLGTAIFLKYHGGHFLLSARHVFADDVNDTDGICDRVLLVENFAGKRNDTTNQRFIESGTANDLPTGTINTNVPNQVTFHNTLISNVNSEVRKLDDISNQWGYQYILSPKSDDIGLIALDSVLLGKQFIQTLYKRGYAPINISDIDTTCDLKRLDSVFCIGYPQESIVESHSSSFAKTAYIANITTLNYISKGFVLTSPRNSNFFEASIFTYHGFSGGPVIRNNKLIGIVSGFDRELKISNNQAIKALVVYHSKFVKSSIIYKYLQQFGSSKDFILR
jgi:hypothetical protein